MFHELLLKARVTSAEKILLNSLKKYFYGNCCVNLKFRVLQHDLPCVLEKMLMVEVNNHLESCSSVTKKKLTPFP